MHPNAMRKYSRRDFILNSGIFTGILFFPIPFPFPSAPMLSGCADVILTPISNEDLFSYINRVKGNFDQTLYRQIVGSANTFKEGDLAQGVAAFDDNSRINARKLLTNTKIKELCQKPLFTDDILTLIQNTTDQPLFNSISNQTLGEFKFFLLRSPEKDIQSILPGLTSDLIGCLVKILSNEELITIGQKVFNPLPGSKIGSKGYLSARIQPNSPTDNPDDIMMQVFNGWSYGVGDLLLGTNPVSSDPESVAKIENTLRDILSTFGLEQIMPHSVLSHIDIQSEVENRNPGTTGIWFQSLGGTVSANKTFNVTVEKMLSHASKRTGQYGLYVETGQGADFTNGNGEGFDMVVHESRKYGFLRALKTQISKVQPKHFSGPWVHVNDVAGFIGPEVFKTREQLVRCCLEDTVMGKLHGLTIGLDICSTLHMDITLDDLEWCIDQIMPVNPAYLMALPTKNDPMLSYLTTGFNDHVRIRAKFGYKVNDAMWEFFKRIEIIDQNGNVTSHFGDPLWVYFKYRIAKGDLRSHDEIYTEGMKLISEIEERGVPIAQGYGKNTWVLEPKLDRKIHALYADSKICLWREMSENFLLSIPNPVYLQTTSTDRRDYIYHPPTGELMNEQSVDKLISLSNSRNGIIPDVQIIISDGLNVSALTDEGHLKPFLDYLNIELIKAGLRVSSDHIIIRNGRVRAGYRCGEYLFGKDSVIDNPKGIIHIIGERPGSGHHNFSAYISAQLISNWKMRGKLDHNSSKVVSGISDTALLPELAANQTVRILAEMLDSVRK